MLLVGLLGLCLAPGCGDRVDDEVGSPGTIDGGDNDGHDSTDGLGDTAPDIGGSVFQVKANRCASPENSWTTGFAIDDTTIATVAHALESTLAVSVIDQDGNESPVEIAYVDEGKDIALLRLADDVTVNPLPMADEDADGEVWLVTFKHKDTAPVFQQGTVLSLVEVTMDGEGARDAIKLTADISVGDSGGPVVNRRGELLGMIFATTIDERTGWAIAHPEVSQALATKNGNRPEVIPPACLTDPLDKPESGSAVETGA